MRPLRVFAAGISVVACVAVAGCGSTGQKAAPIGKAAAPAQTTTPTPSTTSGCGPFPPRHAWVQAVATNGTEHWRTPLHISKDSGNESQAPLVVNGTVIAAQDGVITALDEKDGHLLWSWNGGKSIYGMWLAGTSVVVLTDQVGPHAGVTALDLTNGHRKWRRAISGQGLLCNVVATPAERLAWVRADGVLQVLRMSDGAVQWSHPATRSPALIALDGRVLFAASGSVTAYDEATGRLAWKVGGVPQEPALTSAAGLALVSSRTSGGSSRTAVVALDPRSGKVRWRFDTGAVLSVLGSDQTRILAAEQYSQLLLLDARSGRPLWRTDASPQDVDASPLLLADRIVNTEGGVLRKPKAQLVARSLATGRQLWATQVSGLVTSSKPLQHVGSLVVDQSPPRGPGQASALTAYAANSGQVKWSVRVPTLVQAPTAVDGSTIIVQSADPGYGCSY